MATQRLHQFWETTCVKWSFSTSSFAGLVGIDLAFARACCSAITSQTATGAPTVAASTTRSASASPHDATNGVVTTSSRLSGMSTAPVSNGSFGASGARRCGVCEKCQTLVVILRAIQERSGLHTRAYPASFTQETDATGPHTSVTSRQCLLRASLDGTERNSIATRPWL